MSVVSSPFKGLMLVTLIFFFNDTATAEIYTLSLHDALPICAAPLCRAAFDRVARESGQGEDPRRQHAAALGADRKSTRLNSSHSQISYAVFCLTKKTLPILISVALLNTSQGLLDIMIQACTS